MVQVIQVSAGRASAPPPGDGIDGARIPSAVIPCACGISSASLLLWLHRWRLWNTISSAGDDDGGKAPNAPDTASRSRGPMHPQPRVQKKAQGWKPQVHRKSPGISWRDGMAEVVVVIWGEREVKCFFAEIWTGRIALKSLQKLTFTSIAACADSWPSPA